MNEANDVMIEVEHLEKHFGSLHVLKDISFKIQKKEVVAIMGPSGSGKSTLLRCLNRLEEPTSGKILIEGVNIIDPHVNINKIRTEIGMVFQLFGLYPHLTALQNITLAPINVRRISHKEADERARALLERVGLSEKADKYPDQLSGGQQQRVAIARALAMQPKMMFFDEPTSALDPEMIREVLDVMVSLATDDNMTMIVVSHEMGFIREASTRVLVLDNGQIVEEGESKELFNNPKHERTQSFLGKIIH
jgi:ABC-type polar amino acid transport system ATPase subunit